MRAAPKPTHCSCRCTNRSTPTSTMRDCCCEDSERVKKILMSIVLAAMGAGAHAATVSRANSVESPQGRYAERKLTAALGAAGHAVRPGRADYRITLGID